MQCRWISGSFVLSLCTLLGPASLSAQQVMLQSPLQRQGTSFYESTRLGWSVQHPNYFLRFNGGPVAPPFGGASPGAGLRGGLATGNLQLGFEAVQGSSLNSVSTTPVLMTTNGYPGSLFIGSQRPFVTGVAPVVAGGAGPVAPVGPLVSRMAAGEFRIDSGKVRAFDEGGMPPAPLPAMPAAGVPAAVGPRPQAAVRQSAPADGSAADLVKRAEAAEREGRVGAARLYYQLAAARADAVTRLQIQARLDELPSSPRK